VNSGTDPKQEAATDGDTGKAANLLDAAGCRYQRRSSVGFFCRIVRDMLLLPQPLAARID